MPVSRKLTDASKKNSSGLELEDALENKLKSLDIAYHRAKTGSHEIDFIIRTENNLFYVECKNQNGSGTVEEKIPHTVWKYWKKYNYKDVYIIRGDYMPSAKIIEHCEYYPFTTHIMTLEEFIRLISNQPIYRGLYDVI